MSGERAFELSKKNRLLKQKDFDRVYQKGKSYQGHKFCFYYLEKDNPPPRLGLSVGKEVGKATQRNKIKRIIRETFRTHKKLFGNMDIIIRPLPEIGKSKKREIRQALLESLHQLPERGDSHAGRRD